MPNTFIYLIIMLVFILVWFILIKRPIYEALLLCFILIVAITNKWANIFLYLDEAMSTSLLYSMIVFVAMSQILSHTKIIDSCVYLILSLFGRISGGAGYASIIASSFMGALSGSGPGNVMATGVITIPAMKKSGFPAHLAANVESTSSYLGNMIPPSSNIVAAFGAYMAVYPTSTLTSGQFWVVLWGISLWFVLSRILTLFAFCKYYKLKPMAKEEVPTLKEAFIKGWKGLLLPIIILFPFIFDATFESFIIYRLGTVGASYFSKSLLLFVAGIASIYAVLICEDRKQVTPKQLILLFAKKAKSLVAPIAACLFGYAIGEVFADLNLSQELGEFFSNLGLNKVGLAFVIPLLTTFLGMVIPGSSQVVIFGPAFITIFASCGVNPVLIAAMLPCICGVMCGITPPLALGMYAGMSIAESDFKKTVINDLWWVLVQYLLEVIVLLGFLPIIGL